MTLFCVYGHEHVERADALACDRRWDDSWKGSICGLHDAGLLMACTCTPTDHSPSMGPRTPRAVEGHTGPDRGCICITHYEDGHGVIPRILSECPYHRGVHPLQLIDGEE